MRATRESLRKAECRLCLRMQREREKLYIFSSHLGLIRCLTPVRVSAIIYSQAFLDKHRNTTNADQPSDFAGQIGQTGAGRPDLSNYMICTGARHGSIMIVPQCWCCRFSDHHLLGVWL